ncbi:MAG: hypothetical protein ACT4QE_16755 [Anaerolineales bacterium]
MRLLKLTFSLLVLIGTLVLGLNASAQGVGPATGGNVVYLPYISYATAWRPFSSSSPWNVPISANPAIDPNNSAMIQLFNNRSYQDPRPWININRYSAPLWVADSNAPRYNVDCGSPNCAFFQSVPIPNNAVPDPESDGHMIIVDVARQKEWDFYRARKRSDGSWAAVWGAYFDLTGNGVLAPGTSSARASGFPLSAGMIYADEIQDGRIRHALVMVIAGTRHGCRVWPATATYGWSYDSRALPMGARIQLDPTLDLNTLNLSPGARVIARALQEYGAYVGDEGSSGVGFIAESFTGKPVNRWTGLLRENDLVNLPTDRFRVLNLGPLTCT